MPRLKPFFFTPIFLFLSGCLSQSAEVFNKKPNPISYQEDGVVSSPRKEGMNKGPVPSILSQFPSSDSEMLARFKSAGIYAVKIGDTISILLPVDDYFAPKDDLLVDDQYKNLNLIAASLVKYHNAAIKIAVSTDDVGAKKRNKFLAKLQAERIAAYFWRQGISAWRLYPVSYGSNNLLATNRTVWGSQKNRTIEITVNRYVTPANCCKGIEHFVAKKQPWQYWGLPYSSETPPEGHSSGR